MSIKLMQRIWDLDLPSTRKFVFLSLGDQANDQGDCYPSIQTIMTRCSLSRRAVFDALRELEDGAYIERMQRPGRGVMFKIADPCAWRTGALRAPVQQAHQCATRTGASDAQGGAPGARGGAAGAPVSAPRALHIKQPPTNPHLIPTEPPQRADERDDGFEGHDRDQVPEHGRAFERLDDHEQTAVRPLLGTLPPAAAIELKLLAEFVDHARLKPGVVQSPAWFKQLAIQIAVLHGDGHDVNEAIRQTIAAGNCVQLLIPKNRGSPASSASSSGRRQQADDFEGVSYG